MEDERKGKDPAWLITHPRELCKRCLDWYDCSGEPWDDMSGCAANTGIIGNGYLLGRTDTCKHFFEY